MKTALLEMPKRLGQAAAHASAATFSAMRNARHLVRIRQRLKSSHPRRPLLGIGLIQHIGDIAASEPLGRRLRELHPEAYIVWCVRAPFRDLVSCFPYVDEVLPVYCMTEWILLRKSGRFEIMSDLHVDGSACHVCAIPLRKRENKSAVKMTNYFTFGSLTEIFARGASISGHPGQQQLAIPQTAVERVLSLNLPPRFIVIHGSSEQALKNWTEAGWRHLVERVWTELGVPTVEVGLRSVFSPSSKLPGHIDLCGQLSLPETAAVLRQAELFVGIDSGPAQLSNSVGTYGVILLGPYFIFKEYNPYSGAYGTEENCVFLRTDEPVSMIAPENVFAAVRNRLRLDLAPKEA